MSNDNFYLLYFRVGWVRLELTSFGKFGGKTRTTMFESELRTRLCPLFVPSSQNASEFLSKAIILDEHKSFWFDYINDLVEEQIDLGARTLNNSERSKINIDLFCLVRTLLAVFNAIELPTADNRINLDEIFRERQFTFYHLLYFSKCFYYNKNGEVKIPMLMTLVWRIYLSDNFKYGKSSPCKKVSSASNKEISDAFTKMGRIILNDTVTYDFIVEQSWKESATAKAAAETAAETAAKAAAETAAKAAAETAAKAAAETAAKAAAEPAAKAAAETAAQTAAKAAAEPAAKAAAETAAETAAKAAAETAAKAAAEPAAKAAVKTSSKADTKLDIKPTAKPIAKPPAKTTAKPPAKTTAKPAAAKNPAKTDASNSSSENTAKRPRRDIKSDYFTMHNKSTVKYSNQDRTFFDTLKRTIRNKHPEQKMFYISDFILLTDALYYICICEDLEIILFEDSIEAIDIVTEEIKPLSNEQDATTTIHIFYDDEQKNEFFSKLEKIPVYEDNYNSDVEITYVFADSLLGCNNNNNDQLLMDIDEDDDMDYYEEFSNIFIKLHKLNEIIIAKSRDDADVIWSTFDALEKKITVVTYDGYIKYPNGTMRFRPNFTNI
jgi:hypothetical protein